MEAVANERLRWYLEKHNILNKIQSGFRANHSTLDHILRLQDLILKQINTKGYVAAIFIDFEKAYDMVWHRGLIHKIKNLGVSGNMLNFIANFLTNRSFQVRIGNSLSSKNHFQNGIPQGSIISPLLFLIAINDFPQTAKTDTSLFADDSAIFAQGKNLKFVITHLQSHLDEVQKWSEKWGFKISTSKTVQVLFTRRKTRPEVNTKTYIKSAEIPNQKSAKFLGLIFDSQLNWREHVTYIRRRVQCGINLLKSLTSSTWGADKKTLLTIYKMTILPIIDYGSLAYDNLSPYLSKAIESLQNQALKIICGAALTTPVAALQNECGVLPLHLKRLENQIKFSIKSQQTPNHNIHQTLLDHWTLHYGNYKTHSSPIFLKISEYLHDHPPNMELKLPPETPPWRLKKPQIDISLTNLISKKETNPEVIKKLALDRISLYLHSLHIYTDGSKTPDNHTAFAFHVPNLNEDKASKINPESSIFTAELMAIKTALEWCKINVSAETKITIFSDSKSSLQAIQNYTFKRHSNLIHKIIELNSESKNNITLVWIPSHVGLPGNEKADELAKLATQNQTIDINNNISFSESLPAIIDYINAKWQDAYNSATSIEHFRAIEPTVSRSLKFSTEDRKTETIITRIRLGTCHLPFYLHKFGKHPTGLCETCNKNFNIAHLLMECPNSNLPSAIKMTCGQYNIPLNFPEIISSQIITKIVSLNLPPKRHL